MDLKQLNYFKHVAELGSFSKASTFLNIAQPALSRQVKQLEDRLGISLLYRNGRGVTMTKAGELLLVQANLMLEQLNRTYQEIAGLKGDIAGRTILGLPPTVSQVLVRPLINSLRTEYPDISLQVVEAFSGHVLEWLGDGRLDVAVLYNAPRTRHLKTDRLLIEELVLVSPSRPDNEPGGDIEMSKLEHLPLVLPSRPHGLRLLVDEVAAKHGLKLQVNFEIDALSLIKDLVEDGAGSTILPYVSVHRETIEGKMATRRIAGQPFTRTLVMATSTQRPLTTATRTLAAFVKAEVKNLHGSGIWLGSTL
jgi:LysR family nitrogen assimilation transcriptional regulator